MSTPGGGSFGAKHKNFSTRPHCAAKGDSGMIVRMTESSPLISRSDGSTYHLLTGWPESPLRAKRRINRRPDDRYLSLCPRQIHSKKRTTSYSQEDDSHDQLLSGIPALDTLFSENDTFA